MKNLEFTLYILTFTYVSEVLGNIPAISSYTHSVVDIGKSQSFKKKFKVFHKISVILGYF